MEILISQCWRPEVQNQGIGRTWIPLGSGWNPPLPLIVLALPATLGSWACNYTTPISALIVTWPSPSMSLSLHGIFSSYKDTRHIRLGPTLMTSL